MQNKENINFIIDGCLRSNESAQRKLFEQYYGYVKSICLRYASRSEEADEMLNDAFYKVFKYLDRFDKQFDFLPWLRKVSINVCLEYIRSHVKQIKFESVDALGIELQADDEQEDIEIIDSIDITACLQKLSPSYRTVFNLFVFEEYKHHEIADILGISVSASKTNLMRAKLNLKTILEKNNAIVSQSKISKNE